MKSIVAVRKCEDYDLQTLTFILEATLNDAGGLQTCVSRGDRVLLKPNLLMSADPSRALVTHPALVEAVASLIIDLGAIPFIGDSPPLGSLQKVLSKSGYDPFMKKLGIKPVPFLEKIPVEFSNGRLFRRIDLAQEVFQFDCVINLPKLKTHVQMFLTLAVKNLFGTIIGTDKASWHMRAGRDFQTFATVLIQILEKVRPRMSILDGILAMEGNGPNFGTPRHVGILGASTDAVALDAVVCRLLGFQHEMLLTCLVGQELGVGSAEEQLIELKTNGLEGFPLKDFTPPKTMNVTWNMSQWNPIRKFMENHVITRPEIDPSLCRCCGVCRDHCPPSAIREKDGVMTIDRRACITCFCCHELCVHNAVHIVEPFLGRWLSSLSR